MNRVLYYPHIHFANLEWVKCALLYWEGVRRVIPYEGFALSDPPDVRQLVRDKLVEQISAMDYRSAAAKAFTPRLEALLKTRKGRLLGTPGRIAARALGDGAKPRQVHHFKIDELLVRRLTEAKLATPDGPWIRMAPGIAGLYMLTLCGQAADDLGDALATDLPDCEVGSLYFNTPGGRTEASRDSIALARMICPFPRPAHLAKVPLDRILEVRKSYSNERRAFRAEMEGVAKELATAKNKTQLRDLVNDKRAEVEERMKEMKEMTREFKAGLVWDAVNLSVPSGIAAAAAAVLPPVGAVVAGTAALVIGMANWFIQRRARRRDLSAKTPWHYLMTLQKTLPFDTALSRFNSGMQQLAYD